MFSGFQTGYQAGFQVIYPRTAHLDPNGNLLSGSAPKKYIPRSFELQKFNELNRLEQLRAQKKTVQQDLRAEQLKIEALELRRLKRGLANKELQADLLELFLKEQQILARTLELERLIFEIEQEEEAIMIILLTMPF